MNDCLSPEAKPRANKQHFFCMSNVHTLIISQKRTKLNLSHQAKTQHFPALFSSDFSRKISRCIQETIPFKVGVCVLHRQNNNIICTHSLFFFFNNMNWHRTNLKFVYVKDFQKIYVSLF